MSKLPILDMKGAAAGEFEIADDLLVLDRGAQAVHDTIVATLATRRAGTASTLGKGAGAGSNRKPWRQKGTGRARAGYRRSPVWRGGGVAHGPHPHSYEIRVPKKVARLAFAHAFSARAADGGVRVLAELALADGKTKGMAAVLAALGVAGKALLVVDRVDPNLARAARNIDGLEVTTGHDVSTYQIARYAQVIVTKAAMESVIARLQGRAGRAA